MLACTLQYVHLQEIESKIDYSTNAQSKQTQIEFSYESHNIHIDCKINFSHSWPPSLTRGDHRLGSTRFGFLN